MTIGIGWTDGNGAILACDEQETFGGDKELSGDKHFEVRGVHGVLAGAPSSKYFVLGTLSSGGMVGLARPGHPREVSVRQFASALRAALEEYGWMPECVPGKAPYWEISMLLTDGRRLFEINTNLVPREIQPEQYVAIGSGWDQAIAVVRALEATTLLPAGAIMHTAVDCAIAHTLSCGGEPQTYDITPSDSVTLVW